jgi:hypothetical protein
LAPMMQPLQGRDGGERGRENNEKRVAQLTC